MRFWKQKLLGADDLFPIFLVHIFKLFSPFYKITLFPPLHRQSCGLTLYVQEYFSLCPISTNSFFLFHFLKLNKTPKTLCKSLRPLSFTFNMIVGKVQKMQFIFTKNSSSSRLFIRNCIFPQKPTTDCIPKLDSTKSC